MLKSTCLVCKVLAAAPPNSDTIEGVVLESSGMIRITHRDSAQHRQATAVLPNFQFNSQQQSASQLAIIQFALDNGASDAVCSPKALQTLAVNQRLCACQRITQCDAGWI
jgi:hypothetical protein